MDTIGVMLALQFITLFLRSGRRSWGAFAERFAYGYNGMEKDDELLGEGAAYYTEFRQLDVSIGRWFISTKSSYIPTI